MEPDGVHLIGVHLKDKVFRDRFYIGADGQEHHETKYEPIPEKLMSELDDLSGDGKGRVTVGGDMSSTAGFCKANAFVSISITCDGSLEACEEAHNRIHPVVARLVEEDHRIMSDKRDQLIEPSKRLNLGASEGKVSAPPRKKVVGKPTRPGFRR